MPTSHMHASRPPTTTMTSFPDDCLPPEGQFDSKEALLTAIDSWESTRGYAFITSHQRIDPVANSTTPASSTRREPSAFELVEQQQQPRP